MRRKENRCQPVGEIMSKENADYLMQAAQNAGIADHKELANFMGQMQIESRNFDSFEEDLHYRPEQLLKKFKDRNGLQTLDQAREIVAGGPEAIANEIYGGEWGRKNLGNTELGDGYTYPGRGFTQLTGRDQYRIHGDNTGIDVTNQPDAAAERSNAAYLAIDKWKTDVVRLGDQQDVRPANPLNNGDTNRAGPRARPPRPHGSASSMPATAPASRIPRRNVPPPTGASCRPA